MQGGGPREPPPPQVFVESGGGGRKVAFALLLCQLLQLGKLWSISMPCSASARDSSPGWDWCYHRRWDDPEQVAFLLSMGVGSRAQGETE